MITVLMAHASKTLRTVHILTYNIQNGFAFIKVATLQNPRAVPALHRFNVVCGPIKTPTKEYRNGCKIVLPTA